jgi:hypothetical protein
VGVEEFHNLEFVDNVEQEERDFDRSYKKGSSLLVEVVVVDYMNKGLVADLVKKYKHYKRSYMKVGQNSGGNNFATILITSTS